LRLVRDQRPLAADRDDALTLVVTGATRASAADLAVVAVTDGDATAVMAAADGLGRSRCCADG
jgi:hypothetical protein